MLPVSHAFFGSTQDVTTTTLFTRKLTCKYLALTIGIVDLLAKLLLLDWVVIKQTILMRIKGLIEVTAIAITLTLTLFGFLATLSNQVVEDLRE